MPDSNAVPALIGQLYDAALDPTLWPTALTQIKDFVGGSTGSLVTKDAANRSMDVYYDDGSIEPYLAQALPTAICPV